MQVILQPQFCQCCKQEPQTKPTSLPSLCQHRACPAGWPRGRTPVAGKDGGSPSAATWLVSEPLSWTRGAEGKTQPCKEMLGSSFKPSNNSQAPSDFIKTNQGHLLPPLAGLETGLISQRKQGVNICLLQAPKTKSQVGFQVIQNVDWGGKKLLAQLCLMKIIIALITAHCS